MNHNENVILAHIVLSVYHVFLFIFFFCFFLLMKFKYHLSLCILIIIEVIMNQRKKIVAQLKTKKNCAAIKNKQQKLCSQLGVKITDPIY